MKIFVKCGKIDDDKGYFFVYGDKIMLTIIDPDEEYEVGHEYELILTR